MSDSSLRPFSNSPRFGAMTLVAALVAGLAFGGILVWAFSDTEEPAQEAEEHTELPPGVVELPLQAQKNANVQIVPASAATLPTTMEVTGSVAPDEARIAHIRPLARGVVQSVAVRLGDRVSAGQALATLDNVELGTLVGEYLSEVAAQRQAETDREVRQKALDRAQALIKIEGIAQQELDLRTAEFRNAEAAVSSQRARVAKIEEQIHRFGITDRQLERLATPGADHRTESLSVLRAPFDGIVTKYDIAAGELVESDQELFTVANISTVWVMADIYEKDLSKIQRGVDVSVRVDAYPDRIFAGRLTYVADLIDPETRTAKARCVVTNQDDALKLDMFARISIPTSNSRKATVVPVAAVQQVDGASVVFVRQSDDRFQRRDVEVGGTAGDVVEIVSGLKPGEQVVAAGSFYLKTALLRERIGDEH